MSRTAHYYKPKGESEENLQIMKKIDKEHIEHPAKGVVGMTDFLLENNFRVGLRRLRRLMRQMGRLVTRQPAGLSTIPIVAASIVVTLMYPSSRSMASALA